MRPFFIYVPEALYIREQPLVTVFGGHTEWAEHICCHVLSCSISCHRDQMPDQNNNLMEERFLSVHVVEISVHGAREGAAI